MFSFAPSNEGTAIRRLHLPLKTGAAADYVTSLELYLYQASIGVICVCSVARLLQNGGFGRGIEGKATLVGSVKRFEEIAFVLQLH